MQCVDAYSRERSEGGGSGLGPGLKRKRNDDEDDTAVTPTKSRPGVKMGGKDAWFDSSPTTGASPSHDCEDGRDPWANEGPKGFTLSYLVRVPTLRTLALRILEAARKATEKAARQASAKSQATAIPPSAAKAGKQGTESAEKKCERLFRECIREKFTDGGLVLWDPSLLGPTTTTRLANSDDDFMIRKWDSTGEEHSKIAFCERDYGGGRGMWKLKSGMALPYMDPIDNDDLLPPNPSEEAFIPVTSILLRLPIVTAIDKYNSTRRTVPSNRPTPATSVHASFSYARTKPGVTEDDILAQMCKADSRWDHLSVMQIQAALQEMEEEGVSVTFRGHSMAMMRTCEIRELSAGRWGLC